MNSPPWHLPEGTPSIQLYSKIVFVSLNPKSGIIKLLKNISYRRQKINSSIKVFIAQQLTRQRLVFQTKWGSGGTTGCTQSRTKKCPQEQNPTELFLARAFSHSPKFFCPVLQFASRQLGILTLFYLDYLFHAFARPNLHQCYKYCLE